MRIDYIGLRSEFIVVEGSVRVDHAIDLHNKKDDHYPTLLEAFPEVPGTAPNWSRRKLPYDRSLVKDVDRLEAFRVYLQACPRPTNTSSMTHALVPHQSTMHSLMLARSHSAMPCYCTLQTGMIDART